MQQDQLTLLQAFPWLNSQVLAGGSLGNLSRSEALAPYGTKVKPVLNKLASFERLTSRKHPNNPMRRVLLAKPDALIESRLQDLSTLSQEDMSTLVSILLDLRLIDVAIYLQEGLSPAGQTARLPIPLPSKMFFKQATNWPALVTRGLQLLRDCDDDVPMPDCEASQDTTSSIFVSLLYRRETIDGHKIMGNFQCAAAHLSLIFKGIVDLPPSLSEFKTLVMGMCTDHGLPAERWETFFDAMKTSQAFKLPLHLALSCSPVCLFLPSNLMTKDLSRLVLLQMWQGLGGPRPEQLQIVEATLWRALFESALGLFPVSPRLKSAFQELSAVDLSLVGYPSLEWLAGSASFTTMLSNLGAKGKRASSNAPERQEGLPNEVRPECSPTSGGGVDARMSGHPPSTPTPTPQNGPMTRSKTIVSKAESNTPIVATSGGVETSTSVRRKAGPRRSAMTSTRSSRVKIRASSEADSSDDLVGDQTDLEPEERVRAVRKRAASASSDPPPQVQNVSIKALKLEDGSRSLQLYETIDLASETAPPPVIDLTIDDDGEGDRFNTPMLTLWDASRRINYVPEFHHREEANWFSLLSRVLIGCQAQVYPPHIQDKSSSVMDLIDHRCAAALPASELQDRLKNFIIILVPTILENPLFDSAALESFCMLDKVIPIRNFSTPPDQNRMVTGTLLLLLQSAQTSGKSLAAPDVPIPGGPAPFPSLASDVHAWDMTIDQPWCSRRWEHPRSAVRWAEVSTRNAYRSMSLSPNGFATQIDVRTGSQLLIICQPSPFNPHPISSISTLESLRNPYIAETKTFVFQAIHLRAGYTGIIKPMVPFMLLSTKHSVVQMSQFYASSTLQASCIGFLHSALIMDPSSNPSQKAAQSLLRRLVHYFYLVYTGIDDASFPPRQQFPHVPDVLTVAGVIDLLSICNVFELSNALAYSVSPLDRHMLVETRRLCRRLVAWLDSRLRFSDSRGHALEISKDLWKVYLAHQIKTLFAYHQSLERRGVSFRHTVREKLEAYIQEDAHLLSHLRDLDNQRRGGDDFEWPNDVQFCVDTRLPPKEMPCEIRGETADDLAFFGGDMMD